MNYSMEDGFDFYNELNKELPAIEIQSSDIKEDMCMISHLPLTYNSVTLPCSHKFNYIPLYTELCLHNNGKNIICPYCRTVSTKLMPCIILPGVSRVYGVNYPLCKCLPLPKCGFKLISGARKNMACNMNGIDYPEGTFCEKHKHHINQTKDKEIWTMDMETLYKTKNVAELKKLLREKGLAVGGIKKELVVRLFS